MNGSTAFFIAFSALIALAGLFAAAMAQDFLHVFGLGLFAFGVAFAFACLKRHFDEKEGAGR